MSLKENLLTIFQNCKQLFKVYLSQRINVEKHIYFIKNRLAQFDTKWVNLKPLIEDNA